MNAIENQVLVIGAGIVGSTQALALGKAGLNVTLIDRDDPSSKLTESFDGRTSAIALANKRALENLGVWQHLEDKCAPILDIRISEKGSPIHLHYDHREVGDEPLGYIIQNSDLRFALFKEIRANKNIINLAPEEVVKTDRSEFLAQATLSDNSKITASLIIAADGKNSPIRKEAKIRVTKWKYNQTAIVFAIKHEYPHCFIAYEHFLPSGPLAILPIKARSAPFQNMSSVVWTEKNRVSPILMSLSKKAFETELMSVLGDSLGKIEVVGSREAYPLGLQFAENFTSTRLALIGDAIHSIHPIAGQGLNMGLRDVSALSETVINAQKLGLDIGDYNTLSNYQKWRRFDNTVMIASTDSLNRLFSNDFMPLKIARNIGLASISKIPVLKRFFMRHAMGLTGEIPHLMRIRSI